MQLKIVKSDIIELISAEAKIIFAIFGANIRLVGGGVRNLLIKKEVSDFDFATILTPFEIIKILKKNNIIAIDKAIKYGTVIAVINNKNIEITTLRIDKNHQGRACNVDFVDNYEVDASRRDFTINALYLDEQGLIYDYFNGIDDLKKSQVKFIGDANARIKEDYLRILRFFRFTINYSQTIDNIGLDACIINKKSLNILAKERIRKEFYLLLESKNLVQLISILKILNESQIAIELFQKNFDYLSLESFFTLLKNSQIIENLNFKLALILIPNIRLNQEYQLDFIENICASNYEKKYFSDLIKIAKIISEDQIFDLLSEKNYQDLNILFVKIKELLLSFEPSILADGFLFLTLKNNLEFNKFLAIKKFLNDFILPKFPLNGNDLIAINITGEKIGIALNIAKKYWLENNFECEKSQLLNYLNNFKFNK